MRRTGIGGKNPELRELQLGCERFSFAQHLHANANRLATTLLPNSHTPSSKRHVRLEDKRSTLGLLVTTVIDVSI